MNICNDIVLIRNGRLITIVPLISVYNIKKQSIYRTSHGVDLNVKSNRKTKS